MRVPDERLLLDGLLAHDFRGVEEFRLQAGDALAKKNCSCGCATIDFVVLGSQPASEAASPVPVERRIRDADREDVGGLLFCDGRSLGSLEVYSYDEPLPLPRLVRVTWEQVSRG